MSPDNVTLLYAATAICGGHDLVACRYRFSSWLGSDLR